MYLGRFGPPLEPKNNLKKTLETHIFPCTVLRGRNHVAAALIHTNTHPSSKVYLAHPKGTCMTHLRLLGPYQRPETHPKTPYFAAYPIAWLLMVKITLRQPQFIPALTHPHRSISPIPWHPDSHICGRLGPISDFK